MRFYRIIKKVVQRTPFDKFDVHEQLKSARNDDKVFAPYIKNGIPFVARYLDDWLRSEEICVVIDKRKSDSKENRKVEN